MNLSWSVKVSSRQRAWISHAICARDRGKPRAVQFSRMKVTSVGTRYSSIFPFSTLALCSITCRPVTPRGVPSDEAAVVFATLVLPSVPP